MDAIILTALLRTILTVTAVWNIVETSDISVRTILTVTTVWNIVETGDISVQHAKSSG